MIGWVVAALVVGAIGAGVLTAAALRKAIKRKVSRYATRALLTKVARSGGAYHISIAALDEDGDVVEHETMSADKIDSSEIYTGQVIDL